MDRQQMQGQVYSTPGVTAPAKPALTAADVEKEKNGTNGEVVQLGDAKPAATPEKPTTAATPQTPAEPKPALTPEDTKPAMPGLNQEKIKGLEGVDTSPKSLKEWFSWYDEQKRRMGLETDADREKREKKEKAERIIAAIGDGVSALAQIHAAGNGAVVNQGTGTSLMEGVAKRHERLRRERDANDTKLLSYLRERRNQDLQEKRLRQQHEYQQRRNDEIERAHKATEEHWKAVDKNAADKIANDKEDKEKKREDAKENEKMKEKGRNDRAAASRAAANSRNRYNQSQQTARQREREAAKDKRAKEKQQGTTKKALPGQTQTKTKKKLPK